MYGLVFIAVGFVFDGLGFSRISDYFDDYHGSVSYPSYRVTLQPRGFKPRPDPTFPVLWYGYDPGSQVALDARIVAADLPPEDIGLILCDSGVARALSPDTLYAVELALRANYHTFAFGAAPAFELVQSGPQPGLPDPHWRTPWQWYAWAELLLPVLLALAFAMLIAAADDASTGEAIAQLLAVAAALAAMVYIDWQDYATAGKWPIFKPLLLIGLVGCIIWAMRHPDAPADGEAPEPAPAVPDQPPADPPAASRP